MSKQCLGETKCNKRCVRLTYNEYGYCNLHIGQYQPIINNEDNNNAPIAMNTENIEKVDIIENIHDECVVCFEKCEYATSCNHFVHKHCIYKTGTNLCPICRQTVKLSKKQRRKLNCFKKFYEIEELLEEGLLDPLYVLKRKDVHYVYLDAYLHLYKHCNKFNEYKVKEYLNELENVLPFIRMDNIQTILKKSDNNISNIIIDIFNEIYVD
jgi:hypothetical protein